MTVSDQQAKFVREHVTVPLESLLSLFQNPQHLIQKRKDKLLDYDDVQYALDHAEESDRIAQLREDSLLAKRNYEALNTQLLEELPCFIEAVVNMLYHQLTVLVQAQYTFSAAVAALFPPLLASSTVPSSSPQHQAPATQTQVQQQHAKQLILICKDLAKLSLVPTSLSLNYSFRTERGSYDQGNSLESSRSPEHRSEASQHEASPPDQRKTSLSEQHKTSPLDQSVASFIDQSSTTFLTDQFTEEGDLEREDSDDDDAVLIENGPESDLPAEGTRLLVLYDFISQDSAELSVCAGEVVVLRCPHDRIGCKEWWLVQLETHLQQQGYVPATYLTLLTS